MILKMRDETFTHMAGGLLPSGSAGKKKKAVKTNLYTGSGARHLILSKMFTHTSGLCPQVHAILSCQKCPHLRNIPRFKHPKIRVFTLDFPD